MIPANYSYANSAPETPIPQLFFNAARDLQLPLMNIDDNINDNNNNNNEREDEENVQLQHAVEIEYQAPENNDLMEGYDEEHLDDDDDNNNNNNIIYNDDVQHDEFIENINNNELIQDAEEERVEEGNVDANQANIIEDNHGFFQNDIEARVFNCAPFMG